MKWAWALVVAVLVAGCANEEGADPEASFDDASGGTNETANGNATQDPGQNGTVGNGTAGDAADGNATQDPGQNATGAGNTTTNETRAEGVVLEERFTGLLPVDGLSGAHTFAVPPDSTRLQVVYTSEYVGLFTAVAEVFDPTGTSRMYSLDDCSIGLAPPSGTAVCEMEAVQDVLPGEWSAEVYYQAGQATEEYTLDVTGWGYID